MKQEPLKRRRPAARKRGRKQTFRAVVLSVLAVSVIALCLGIWTRLPGEDVPVGGIVPPEDTLSPASSVVAPEPEPDPDPSPSPDPGTGGEGESYKRDLKLLFPFCIPFDFIHLIQALKAEPETPKFEIPVKLDFVDVDTSIVIDLAWMDPIMKIWRLGELGLFIVMLMKSTSKVIRW